MKSATGHEIKIFNIPLDMIGHFRDKSLHSRSFALLSTER